jgi:hypothetical protein
MMWVDHTEFVKSRIRASGKGFAEYQAWVREEWQTMQEATSLRIQLAQKQ